MTEYVQPLGGIPEKKTLVIGASIKSHRFSYRAVEKLRYYHVPVIAVGLREGTIGDVEIQKPFPDVEQVHTVTLYVGPRNQKFWYDFILRSNPKRVIFNPGTENDELEQLLEEKGVAIEHECTLVMLSNGVF
jgi:uncharacterized protein